MRLAHIVASLVRAGANRVHSSFQAPYVFDRGPALELRSFMPMHEGRPVRGVRDLLTTGRMLCQPVESIDKTQHIRHEDVS